MDDFLFPLIVTLAGGYFFIRNIIYIKNEEKMLMYLKTSPKAKFWVDKFGIEKTASLAKSIFLPLGSLIGLGLLFLGILSLYFNFISA